MKYKRMWYELKRMAVNSVNGECEHTNEHNSPSQISRYTAEEILKFMANVEVSVYEKSRRM